MKAEMVSDLAEQSLAGIIIDGCELGLDFMGDGMIGYKFVGGTRERRRRWNLIIKVFMSPNFMFDAAFFECYGISATEYNSEKWNEEYGTEF